MSTPATVWMCGEGGSPSDPDTGWPTLVVEKVVTSFTNPGGHVLLLPWPTPTPSSAGLLDRELQDALTTVRSLDRTAQVIPLEPEPDRHHPAARPYWADLVGDPQRVNDTPLASRTGGWSTPAPEQLDGAAAEVDLIITSLRPEHSGDRASDQVAVAAARLLRTGGILTVLTHSDWSQGQLIDPTGPMVAAAQNADLLYLQHIIVVHAPVRGGQFVIEPQTASPDNDERSQPGTHRRIHTDLLAFAQPHDHYPFPLTLAASALQPESL